MDDDLTNSRRAVATEDEVVFFFFSSSAASAAAAAEAAEAHNPTEEHTCVGVKAERSSMRSSPHRRVVYAPHAHLLSLKSSVLSHLITN